MHRGGEVVKDGRAGEPGVHRRACTSGVGDAPPPLKHPPAVFQALHGEVGVGPVVRADQLQAQGSRLDALGEQVAGGEEVPLALAHLGAFNEQEAGVEPRARVGRASGAAAGLGDLALVMREDVALPAAVQVDRAAGVGQALARQRAALDVPARVARAPGRVPLHDVAGVGLPQQEVGGVLLLLLVPLVDPPPRAAPQLLQGVAAEPAVVGERLDGVVDHLAARGPDRVRVPALDERLDHRDHLRDLSRRAGHQGRVLVGLARHQQPEPLGVLQEPVRVELGDRERVARVDFHAPPRVQLPALLGFEQAFAGDGHAVLAVLAPLRVVGHVPDVGDVHHVDDGAPPRRAVFAAAGGRDHAEGALHEAPEGVGGEKGAEVADVGVVVDGRPA